MVSHSCPHYFDRFRVMELQVFCRLPHFSWRIIDSYPLNIWAALHRSSWAAGSPWVRERRIVARTSVQWCSPSCPCRGCPSSFPFLGLKFKNNSFVPRCTWKLLKKIFMMMSDTFFCWKKALSSFICVRKMPWLISRDIKTVAGNSIVKFLLSKKIDDIQFVDSRCELLPLLPPFSTPLDPLPVVGIGVALRLRLLFFLLCLGALVALCSCFFFFAFS